MGIKNRLVSGAIKLFRACGLTGRLDTLAGEMAELHKKFNEATATVQNCLEKERPERPYVDKGCQILLGIHYRECIRRGERLPFSDTEFRNHSQNGEDGILLYIFSLIGTTNKVTVEMCAGNGIESNSANLILNHGWYGLLYDGDKKRVERGRHFFNTHPDSCRLPPAFSHAWITRDNVNDLISGRRFEGEIDLFSLDMDGVDYWIWDALEVVSPRVVVVEVQAAWMAEKAVTVPYREDFVASWICTNEKYDMHAQYGGASLPAFVKLARKKGYRLVGCNSLGFNAFFMRNDVGISEFPEIDPASCFTHHVSTWSNQFAMVAFEKLEWVEV